MNIEYAIRSLCQTLEVSPSGCYDWLQRHKHPGDRALEKAQRAIHIKEIHTQSRHTHGCPRIRQSLLRGGKKQGRNRIARLMRQETLCGRPKKKFKVQTPDSRHDHPIAPNRLAQTPAPQEPNQVWVADITY